MNITTQKIITLLDEDIKDKRKFLNDIDLLYRMGFHSEVVQALSTIAYTYKILYDLTEKHLENLENIVIKSE